MKERLNKTVSDRLLLRTNRLERWLEQTRSRFALLPLRLVGYLAIALLLLVSNLVAVVRWPFASLLRDRQSAQNDDDDIGGVASAAGRPVAADAEMLKQLIASEKPVLVDFWAAWCGPCLMMDGSLERLATETGGDCLVAKVDTVRNTALAKQYGVRGLPTLILFDEGVEVARYVGALSHGELRSWVADAVGGSA